VLLARALCATRKLLLLDEPVAGLDPKGREKILAQIKDYRDRKNATVLLISHSMEDVARFTTKILVMEQGKVFCYDTPSAVFSRAKELNSMGLAVPQITRVINRLRSAGIDLPKDIYTVDYAVKKILEYKATQG
jgi:energy-coupling factor transport system ATP-binding protein